MLKSIPEKLSIKGVKLIYDQEYQEDQEQPKPAVHDYKQSRIVQE